MESWLEHFAQTAFRRSADTAHDLKTPLNVAVLNLELLRMRVRKLAEGADDAKIENYSRSIEGELRRMARIFDAFFLLSTPPKGDEKPEVIDVMPLAADAAAAHSLSFAAAAPARVLAHESRIREALKMFFEGASKVLEMGTTTADVACDDRFHLTLSGRPNTGELELTKIFKFYYTDPAGSPDLSLAAARLIVETYGGELLATEESGKVTLRLSLPLGER